MDWGALAQAINGAIDGTINLGNMIYQNSTAASQYRNEMNYNNARFLWDTVYNSENAQLQRQKEAYLKQGFNPNLLAGSAGSIASTPKYAESPTGFNATPLQFGGVSEAIAQVVQSLRWEKEFALRESLVNQQIEESKTREENYRKLANLNYAKSLFELDKVAGYRDNSLWSKKGRQYDDNHSLMLEKALGYSLDNMFKSLTFSTRGQLLQDKHDLNQAQMTYWDRLGLKALQETQESKDRSFAYYDKEQGLITARAIGQRAFNAFQEATESKRKEALNTTVDILVNKRKITQEQANHIKALLVVGMTTGVLNSVASIMKSIGVGKVFGDVLEGVLGGKSSTGDWYSNY